ncbi:hypothetical protein J4440_05275 [Candidatus Woesearchaeota archaeon]|nr:hypothetical protein [Candidatus Woesearchaeota archaeon]
MPDQRDEILKFIKENGPVLPVQIAKFININILFASAMLSELVERKLLKMSNAAIGGSPLYYIQGQEYLMDDRLSKHLGGREKEAYSLLKENRILFEKNLEPWQRIAVKNLKDFAKPIGVIINNINEIFWKYHLIDDKDAENLIRNVVEPIEQPKEELSQTTSNNQIIEEETIEEPPVQEYNEVFVPETKINISQIPEIKAESKIIEKQEQLIKTQEKKIIPPSGKFYNNLNGFFEDNKIKIVNQELIKKEKEFNFIVDIPSNLGDLRYFVKAKSKPSLNESDISMVLGDAKLKNLPAILLFSGKTNKKIILLLETKFKGQLIFKEI